MEEIVYTPHKPVLPDKEACQICGGFELEHYWRCKKCDQVGNGEAEHTCNQDKH